MKFLRETWTPDRWCHCDPVDTIVNVVANVATGGLYSLVKAGVETVKTGNPGALLTQGLDIGLASTGNQFANDVGGPLAATAFNAAGGAAGALGAAGAFSSLPGFAGEGVAPLAAEAGTAGDLAGLGESGAVTAESIPAGGTPLAPGVAPTSADVASTSLTGPVGATEAAPTVSSAAAPGGLITQQAGPNLADMNSAEAWLNGAPENAEAMKSSFSSLNPIAQYAIIAGGTQLLSGAAGGLFQGLSAQKKLALETLINEQNQNQRQRLNQQNSYVPKLTFNPTTPGPAGVLAQKAA